MSDQVRSGQCTTQNKAAWLEIVFSMNMFIIFSGIVSTVYAASQSSTITDWRSVILDWRWSPRHDPSDPI